MTAKDCDCYESSLNDAASERDMQRTLEKNPLLLVQHLAASSHYWVIPQRRLGSEYVTDFMIAEDDSDRLTWTAVELESPSARLFTAGGNPSATLTHAIRQISDWRNWLSRNRSYAAGPPHESGLGLTDIDPELDGLIIIGRDASLTGSQEDRRRRMARESRIRIQTFDWLLTQARGTQVPPVDFRALMDTFFGGAGTSPRLPRRSDADDIVRTAFGGVGSTYTFGTARSYEWNSITLEFGSGEYGVVVETLIDYRSSNSKLTKILSSGDWDDWMDSTAFTRFDNERSLLITEFSPDPRLLSRFHDEGKGVWRQRERFEGRIDLILHLPPDMPEAARVERAYAAKQVLIREIVRLRHAPDHSSSEEDAD